MPAGRPEWPSPRLVVGRNFLSASFAGHLHVVQGNFVVLWEFYFFTSSSRSFENYGCSSLQLLPGSKCIANTINIIIFKKDLDATCGPHSHIRELSYLHTDTLLQPLKSLLLPTLVSGIESRI